MVLCKEAPNYEEWILTEWYDGDDGGLKYEADYLYSFVYWKDYVRRNNITKWCYIKDIKIRYMKVLKKILVSMFSKIEIKACSVSPNLKRRFDYEII